ncbi:MAG: ABC transporter substrate-binding protein [Rhodobacteraceae bacterium]|jgi:polar amino acid transport system substrate-binding protein|nr:ABC transporter substrate-binding protein [Paracoccaceae bacterium]
MKPTRRALAGLAFAAGLAAAVPALAQEVLRVGSYPANPPWEFKDEAGNFRGFEVDIVTEVARRMGRSARIEGYDFRALFVATASNRVDIVISSLTITDERLESQSFTQPYVIGALGVGVRAGSPVAALSDLAGRTVGSIATSFPENWVKERQAELGIAEYKSYDTLANLLADLANGRIDAAVNDVVGLRYAFAQMPGMAVPVEIETGERFAMMMPKNSPLLGEVNDHLSAMKTDGTMAELYARWFGVAPAEGSVTLTPRPVPTPGNY